MHNYICFGLRVDSAVPLPELIASDERQGADVIIRYGSLKTPPEDAIQNHCFVEASEESIFAFWDEIGAVLIRKGREIIVDPLSDVQEGVVSYILSGVCMGLILHQRSFLTLHSSAVRIDDGVVAFLGSKGFGKSTTAAAMHANGCFLVSDDVVAVEPEGINECPTVVPGFPQLKLWPDAVRASLGDDPRRHPSLHPPFSKRACRLREGFHLDPLPLRCIYLLDYDSDLENNSSVKIEAISPQEAFKYLIAHSYSGSFLGNHLTSRSHFQNCTRLVKQVPVRRLIRKPDLERLSEIVRQIEEDVARISQEPVSHQATSMVSL